MTIDRRVALGIAGSFSVGVFAGVWLQHLSPLGRARELWSVPQPIPIEHGIAEVAQIPVARRLVIVAMGQSNAANYVATRAAAGRGVYAFHQGKLFAAIDPLPGGDGTRGSIWTRLGAQLASGTEYDAIVIAVVAQGSTRVRDWAPGGSENHRVASTLSSLEHAALSADLILWQQGETESLSNEDAGADYLKNLRLLQADCRALAPAAIFLSAQATRYDELASNEQIRIAQQAAATGPNAAAGPDLDVLGTEFRSDGVHFNAQGASAAAELWMRAMQPVLAEREKRLGAG